MLIVAFALLAGLPPLAVVRYDGHDCVDVVDAFPDGCDVNNVSGGGSIDVVCGDERDTVYVAADLCAAKRTDTAMTPAQSMYVGCLKAVIKDGYAVDGASRARLTQQLQACACQAEPMAALMQQRAGPDAIARVVVDCKRAAADGGSNVAVFVAAAAIVVVVGGVVVAKKKKKQKPKTA